MLPIPPVADPVARDLARGNLLRRLANVKTAASRIGRFNVLDKLGEGAHGVVYAAFDPQLDRRVALKLLRHQGAQAQARLLREARALARLSHPHVVTVHEAGEADGTVFLAMEFVDGITLDQWLADNRSPEPVLSMLITAGRGLAEAHARGLAHRDFKPRNVMVGHDGRARVTDFGLAQAGADAGGTLGDDDACATQTGTITGTPAYMAPEQHAGGRADALSDQYAFCLTTWEALLGRHPLLTEAGAFPSMEAMHEAKAAGPGSWPSPPASRRVLQALRRGLDPEPGARWPNMEALLDALATTLSARSWPWVVAGVGGLAIVAVGSASASFSDEPPCADPAVRLAGVWDDDARATTEAAFASIGRGYADATWARVSAAADDYATAWVEMARETCESTRVHHDQPRSVMDLRMTCLQQARVTFAATAELLRSADADVVRGADELMGNLRPLAACADIDALQDGVQPPEPEDDAAVQHARSLLATADVEYVAGRYEAAMRSVDAARAELDGVAYGPVQTELALSEGIVRERLTDYGGSEEALRTALTSATTWNQRDYVYEAAAMLVLVVGHRHGEVEQGLRYLDIAKGLAEDNPERSATLHVRVAEVLARAGRFDEAVAEARSGHAIERQPPQDRAKIGAKLAEFLTARGEHAEAEAVLRQALEDFEQALGADHPDAGGIETTLGLAVFGQGRYEDAEAIFRASAATTERALGPDHLSTFTGWSNVGLALLMQGRDAEARPLFERALHGYVKILGADHPDVARARYNFASTLLAGGKYESARDEFEQVLALQRKVLGDEHPDLGMTLNNLANVYCSLDDLARAENSFSAALQIAQAQLGAEHASALALRSHRVRCQVVHGKRGAEQESELREIIDARVGTLGAEHPDVAQSRYVLGTLLLEDGRASEARTEAERIWTVHGETKTRFEGQYAWLLSRALTATDAEPKRARALAERARDAFAARGEHYAEETAEVGAWLQSL